VRFLGVKFLIVGLGSMGKRRIRNLQFLGAGEIIGFDPRSDRQEEAATRYGIKTYGYFEDAFRENPDVFVISTPPDLHLPYALIAAGNKKHFFMEAGVMVEGLDELLGICQENEIIAAPSCTMRFQPSIKLIKKLVEENVIGKILTFNYHSGQYLPDWHPWEDYRSFYVAKKETGACREIVPFELIWLSWVLGKVSAVSCYKGKLSNLDVDIDDAYHLLLKFQNGILGHLLVDVISRVPFRTLRLLSEEGVITWDWQSKCVQVYEASAGEWREYHEPVGTVEEGYIIEEEMYIEEMKRFIKAVKKEEAYGYSLEEDRKILEILRMAEVSAEKGISIEL